MDIKLKNTDFCFLMSPNGLDRDMNKCAKKV